MKTTCRSLDDIQIVLDEGRQFLTEHGFHLPFAQHMTVSLRVLGCHIGKLQHLDNLQIR